MHYNLLTVLGPTAAGKTKIAVNLADDFNGEIISADSRQVYKGMDIGTGKDLQDYLNANINYHLIDICEPFEEYNLFRFKKDFTYAFNSIIRKNKLPLLVGGTGLYLSSVLQSYYLPEMTDEKKQTTKLSRLTKKELTDILLGLKPEVHNSTDLNDKERIIKAIIIEQSRKEPKNKNTDYNSLNIGIKPSRCVIKGKIAARLKARLRSGMIEEVENLLKSGVSPEKMNFFGLEYRFVTLYIQNKINYNDMYQKLNSAINNFAKRQITWFNKMEREGVNINWFKGDNYNEISEFVKSKLKRNL